MQFVLSYRTILIHDSDVQNTPNTARLALVAACLQLAMQCGPLLWALTLTRWQ